MDERKRRAEMGLPEVGPFVITEVCRYKIPYGFDSLISHLP